MKLSVPRRISSLAVQAKLGEWMEARKLLEVANAGLAAEKRTAEDLRALEAALERMFDENIPTSGLRETDAEFHALIARSTHNDVLTEIMRSFLDRMESWAAEAKHPAWFAAESFTKQMWREHRDIYQAIREQNAYLAQEKMKQHLFHVERVMLRFSGEIIYR